MILKLKNKFQRCKNPFFLEDVEIDNILVSNNISSSKKNCKYSIGYLDDDYRIKPLHIMLPKASDYVKIYDGQIKWIYFLIEGDDLLEKYNTVRDKVSNIDIKKRIR